MPTVSIRFTHAKAVTAIDVANTAAAVAKERLESQQQKLATEILILEDAVEDKRKLLELILRPKASEADDPKRAWTCGSGYVTPASCKADHEQSFRKLEGFKAKPVFSIGSIRAAKLTSDS